MYRQKTAIGSVVLLMILAAASAHATSDHGKLSGVVIDPGATPQMGATVLVVSEGVGTVAAQLLTNERGAFSAERLLPGLYSVRVTLAGFLPSIERHVRIRANLTTELKIELDSVFTSFDRLRRRPQTETDPDEWKWVLRTSAATRPILQWLDGEVLAGSDLPAAELARRRRPRGRMELTNGARRPGSIANLADSPATAFAYDQEIGPMGRLLLAGQMSYERSAAAGIATTWLPSGERGVGPETTLVLRQSKLGPAGPTFRGLRMQHTNQLGLGDRFTLHYGAEYVVVGLGATTSSLRPQGKLDIRLTPDWEAAVLIASRPWSSDELQSGALQAALAELDAMPVVLWRNGRPVLERGWHEEVSVRRRLGSHASLNAAVFREHTRDTAVFGRGRPSGADFFQDSFSDGFIYAGGPAQSWGARVVYQQKLAEDFEVAAVYAWAGALGLEDLTASIDLRDALQSRYRHSLAARVSGRLPRLGTHLAASYKWLSGATVTRQDIFGETAYLVEPFVNLSVRQPLPMFLVGGKWEALADFRNLLAQGYVQVNGPDGQIVLVPALRSFRGGVSFQF